MDRRKLIVGGSAAAVVTTLAALAGRGILPAEASDVDTESNPTADHARRVVDLVNVDLGLVNPAGLQSQVLQGSAAYASSSPPPPDPDPVVGSDMESWTALRIADLCGPGAVPDAAADIPETRTLLAFGLLAYSQHQPSQPPQISQGMPVPPVLTALEPDFFPELLGQINVKASDSPAFADALQVGADQLDQLVTTGGGGDGGPAVDRIKLTDNQIIALIVIVVVNLALLKTDGWR